MNITINDEDLKMDEVEEFNSKVRAILIDSENRVLVANYGGVFLFPGGSIEEGEDVGDAVTRELHEETGTAYDKESLEFLTELNYFQRNYLKRNGEASNRLIKTYYFCAEYMPIKESEQTLTEREQKDGFKLEMVPLSELEDRVLNNANDNPRNVYFQKEMLEIVRFYKSIKSCKK